MSRSLTALSSLRSTAIDTTFGPHAILVFMNNDLRFVVVNEF